MTRSVGSSRTAVSALLIAGQLLLTTHAYSEEVKLSYWQSRPPSPFRLNLALELGIVLVAVPIWGTLQFFSGEVAPPHCGVAGNPCDRSSVLSIDQPYISYNAGAERASDIIFPWAMPVIGALMFLDYGPRQWKGYLTDLVIIFESVAVAAAVTHIVRFTTRRPRPFLYLDDADLSPEKAAGRTTGDATMSFWSGHVSYLVAFGVSTAYIYSLRHGARAPSTWVMWSAMLALGAASATLQVFAGDHFVSDVLVGAGVGAGIGLLVPMIHPRRKNLQLIPTVNKEQAGLSLFGRF
jgi:hypothetical protein